jgi:hypothetical protein
MDLDKMVSEAKQIAEINRKMMIDGIAKARKDPPPTEPIESLRERLARVYSVLHAIAELPCVTRPEEAAEETAKAGYHKPCDSAHCAPCMACRVLAIEGRRPFWSLADGE